MHLYFLQLGNNPLDADVVDGHYTDVSSLPIGLSVDIQNQRERKRLFELVLYVDLCYVKAIVSDLENTIVCLNQLLGCEN